MRLRSILQFIHVNIMCQIQAISVGIINLWSQVAISWHTFILGCQVQWCQSTKKVILAYLTDPQCTVLCKNRSNHQPGGCSHLWFMKELDHFPILAGEGHFWHIRVQHKYEKVRNRLGEFKGGHRYKTWGSGPLLRMACTSPMRFHWFLCKMTQIN
jgi:hypothetical protein